jgi:hypothetical protein
MKTFVLVYSGDGGMPGSEAEQKAILQAWTDWFTKLGSSLVDGGKPFAPAAKSISASGKVSDPPAGALATGYSIIKAESLESAVTLAKSNPNLMSGGQITVYETFDIMGM